MTTPFELSAEQMTLALTEGARLSDRLPDRAAAHLLTYTGLPGRADFARHVELLAQASPDVAESLAGYVRDWHALLNDDRMSLTGGDQRLLALAASWAKGIPVDLSASAAGLGTAHARRVLEAMIIGSGMEGLYTLNDGPRLTGLQEFHASLGIAGST